MPDSELDTPHLTLAGARQDALSRHLSGSARLRNARLGRQTAEQRAEREREALSEAEHKARERALRKQVAAEWRASATLAERLRRFRRPLLVVTLALAVVAVAAAAINRASVGLGLLGAVVLVGMVVNSRLAKRRAQQVPDERLDLVREQLERVRSTLPDR
jgi:Flp pilus assembly protein TadB